MPRFLAHRARPTHARVPSHPPASVLTALLASTALVGAGTSLARAESVLPSGGQVASGGVTIGTPQGGALTITQSSPSAIVNWQRFSVGGQNRVDIQQPGSQAALLNRVTGDTPSTIAGQINANGQVYLVNPNGITITRSGKVSAGGGFVGSTLGTTDEDFQAGRRQFRGAGRSAAIANHGRITVGRGGYAALIGGQVANTGTISVPMGRVGLGSGERATLDLSGDGFLQVQVPTAGKGRGALVENAGVISADGGSVTLTAAAAREAARQAVNLTGTIEARSVSGHDGSITLSGDEGAVRVAPTARLDASGAGTANGGGVRISGRQLDVAGTVDVGGARGGHAALRGTAGLALSGRIRAAGTSGKGGRVSATAPAVTMQAASIDASGATGGGSVEVGGGYQGGGSLAHARTVDIDGASAIRADATGTADGGNVVVWSDGATRFAGTITARGGAQGGDGGSVEVSGGVLSLTGAVDATAAKGRLGNILLDPYDLTVTSTPPAAALTPGNGGIAYTDGGTTPGTTSYVTPASLNALGGSITLQTERDLLVASNLQLAGAGRSLTLQAGRNITVNPGLRVSATGAISLSAADASSPIVFPAGGISLGAGSLVSAGSNVALSAGRGGMALNGNVTAPGTFTASMDATGAGAVTIGSGASIAGTGGVSVTAGTGGLAINGRLGTATTTTLTTGGAITQAASGSVIAPVLTGSATSVSLTSASNQIGQIGDLTNGLTASTGGVAVTSSSNLRLQGDVAAPAITVPDGNTVSLTTDYLTVANRVAGNPTVVANGGTVSVAPLTSTPTLSLLPAGAKPGAGTLSLTPAELALVQTNALRFGSPTANSMAVVTGQTGTVDIGDPTGTGVFTNITEVVLQSGGAITEPATAGIGVGTISGQAGSLSFAGDNFVGVLAGFTTNAGLAFHTTNALVVSDAVQGTVVDLSSSASIALAANVSGSTSVRLDSSDGTSLASSGGITQSAGVITSPLLTGQGGNASLGGDNRIDRIGDFPTATALTLRNVQGLIVGGTTGVGAEAGTTTLTVTGAITQDAGSTIRTSNLTGSATRAAFTSAANTVTNVSGFQATAGGFSLVNSLDLQVGGVVGIANPGLSVPAGQAVSLVAPGLTLSAPVLTGPAGAPSGTVELAPATPGTRVEVITNPAGATPGSLSLFQSDLNQIATGTLRIGAALGTTSAGAVNFGNAGEAITLANRATTLDVRGTGAVTQGSGARLTVPTLTGSSGSVTLNGANQIATLAGFTTSGAFSLGDARALSVSGTVSSGTGAMTLNDTGGAITQADGTITAGTLAVTANGALEQTAGTIDAAALTGSALRVNLGQRGNAIRSLGAFTTGGGAFVLADNVASLAVTGGVSSGGGAVTLTNAGAPGGNDVVLSGTIASGAGAVLIAANGTFTNNGGSAAIAADGGYTIYTQSSGNPAGALPANTFGGLTATNFYNDAFDFATGTLSTAVPSGNHFVYGYAASLTPTLTGDANKTYDGTGSASAANLAVVPGNPVNANGIADATTLTFTGATFDTADAGQMKTVTATGVAFASNPNNYRLATATAAAAVGTITPATLTYAAATASRTYGAANPALAGTVTGFVNGESQQSATAGTLAFTTGAGTGSNVGSYAITGAGLTATSGNYVFVQAAANGAALAVTPAPLTVSGAKIYDASTGFTTGQLAVAGAQNGESVTLTRGTGSSASADAGAYAGSPLSGLAISVIGGNGLASNYQLPATGRLGIGQATIAVAGAGGVNKTYNGTTTLPIGAIGYTYAGVLGADAGRVSVSADSARYDSPNVGNRTVQVTGLTLTGAGAANYVLSATDVQGSGMIGTATLTYVADAASRRYGAANPALAGTVTGFVNGESQQSATAGTLAFTTGAGTGSNVGSYAITGAGLTATSGNYVFVQAAANGAALAVTPAPLTVSGAKIYDASTGFTTGQLAAAGAQNGESVTLMQGTGSSASADAGAYAGSPLSGLAIAVTGGNGLASNYQLPATGRLGIGQRPITVTADAQSRVFGDANPPLTYSVGGQGLVGGDTLTGVLASTATTASDVGTYPITQGSLAASANYSLTYLGSDLTVLPAGVVPPPVLPGPPASPTSPTSPTPPTSPTSPTPPVLVAGVPAAAAFASTAERDARTNATPGEPQPEIVVERGADGQLEIGDPRFDRPLVCLPVPGRCYVAPRDPATQPSAAATLRPQVKRAGPGAAAR